MRSITPEEIWKILDGYTDTLADKVAARNDVSGLTCSNCGTPCISTLHPSVPFVNNSPLPNQASQCPACGAIYCPITNTLLVEGRSALH